MKRTKNYFDKPQPSHQCREAISGCIRFDGEDLGNYYFSMIVKTLT